MSVQQLIFLVFAVITLFSALMVVSLRNLLHSALWLIMALLGVASLFALLEASFFAAVQILVYIGAIAILIIFAVMLTHNIMSSAQTQTNRAWGIALTLTAVIFFVIISQISNWSGFTTPMQVLNIPGQEAVMAFGKGLIDPQGFALPFETASVLLLAAMLGGVFIAFDKRSEKKS
jgi:NADH-quinone oxidoreductase subunit J